MTSNGSIYDRLAHPFPEDVEKTLNKGGANLTYVPVAEVIARLNVVLGPENWASEVISVQRDALDPDFVIAHVRLTARLGETTCVKDGVGGQPIKRKRNGEIVDLGDEFKGAVSDALKKAAQQLGVGLYLARDDEAFGQEDPGAHVHAVVEVDPAVQEVWDQFKGIVAQMDDDQRQRLNAFWEDYGQGRPKPNLPDPDLDDLRALIENALLIVEFNAEAA